MNGVTNSIAMPYSGKMVQFYAIPAKTDSGTGRVRLKVEKPVGSTGVMIRYKTSAWVDTDTKDTGIFVATITDDTAYQGINQWYEATDLPLNQDLYFCAFPYRGGSYSSVKTENQTQCRAGGLHAEYTFDSISGNTINDTSGNSLNATNAGVSIVSGSIGVAGYFNTNNYLSTTSGNPSTAEVTYCTIASPRDTSGLITFLQFYNGLHLSIGLSNMYLSIASNSWYYSPIAVTSDVQWCLVCKLNRSTGSLVLKARRLEPASTWLQATGSVAVRTTAGDNTIGVDAGTSSLTTQDQIRIFSRFTTDAEDDNIFNGGAGC